MKRFLILFVISFIFSLLLVTPHALAVELPERINQIGDVYTPKVLPDSPWYILKEIRDQLKILLATDPIRKASYRLDAADKKTLELQQLCEIGKCHFIKSLSPAVINNLSTSTKIIISEKGRGKDISEIAGKVKVDSLKQISVFHRLYKISPPEQKDLLVKTKDDIRKETEAFILEVLGQDQLENFKKSVVEISST